jgi:hypothetical protein
MSSKTKSHLNKEKKKQISTGLDSLIAVYCQMRPWAANGQQMFFPGLCGS